MSILKAPMLAPRENLDLETFTNYPVYCSPKLDGIRCLIRDGHPVTRTLKEIPNRHIRGVLSRLNLPDGLDGELITFSQEDYKEEKIKSYNDIQSDIMSENGIPNFSYAIFDWIKKLQFRIRWIDLQCWFENIQRDFISLVEQIECKDRLDIDICEDRFVLQEGYEGLIIKTAKGYYKQGRATYNDSIIYKLKRFEDSEAEVIDILEAQENTNPAEEDNFGRTKRSKSLGGLIPKGIMGRLVVKDIHHPEWPLFEIGTGFTTTDREWWWKNRDELLTISNDIVKYKYQRFGMKDKPRCPVYLGRRSFFDL